MQNILNVISEKIDKDKKKLKRYKLVDKFISLSIAILNITAVVLAFIALVKILNIIKLENSSQWYQKTSLVLILCLAIMIIFGFILTIIIEIYKYNARTNEYKKYLTTIKDLYVKHSSGLISDEELNEFIDILWRSANQKRKIIVADVVKQQLKKGKK